MKNKQINLLCVVLLTISFILVACGSTSQEFCHPENYDQLSSMIGQTKDDVCEKLGIKEDELENTSVGLYMLPDKIEYYGQSFEVYLTFDVTTDQEALYGFWYRAIFTDDTEQAAKIASELAEELTNKYEGWELYAINNRITEQKELVEFLDTDEVHTVAEALNLSKEVSGNMKDFMSDYEQEQGKKLQYGLLLEATTVGESQVTVTLKYEMVENVME